MGLLYCNLVNGIGINFRHIRSINLELAMKTKAREFFLCVCHF